MSINCKDARDLDILVFSVFGFLWGFLVFWFLFLCSWFWFFWFGVFRFFGVLLWGFLFCFLVFVLVQFQFFVILIVVAYCTQLLSQAMYNLMMATMAETCSCQLPSTIQLHKNNNIVVFDFYPLFTHCYSFSLISSGVKQNLKKNHGQATYIPFNTIINTYLPL